MPVVNTELLSVKNKLRDAIRVLELSHSRIAIVVNRGMKLEGVITDGDVRRGILNGRTLDDDLETIMNREPLIAHVHFTRDQLRDVLTKHAIEAIPVVDKLGNFLKVVHLSELVDETHVGTHWKCSALVIMAGGEGKRLRPLTNTTPKPMLEINGVSVLERLVRSAVKSQVNKIYIATNYKSDQISSHFGDGSRFGVDIRYLREDVKLGTAGALSLLDEITELPVLVVNGDVLTTSSYQRILSFHFEQCAEVTVGVVQHVVQIPYGVVQIKNDLVQSVTEKPSQTFLCNAGIYVISAKVLRSIPKNQYLDMPDLIQMSLARSDAVCAFPIHEYWTDIGTKKDLEEARKKIASLEGSDE